MACDVETGRPALVIAKTERAAESAVIKAPGKAEIAPSLPRVDVVPAPEINAPKTTKIEQIKAADRQVSILVPTAVPKTLAASFAPKDQPKNNPLDKKSRRSGSIIISFVF